MTVSERWYSERVGCDVTLLRWGELGVPVLVFPTAGGDAGEVERMGLVGALGPLLSDGRIKVYSVDSIAGRSWLERRDPLHAAWLQNQFDGVVRWEVVPAIRNDCRSGDIEVITAGASIGAFNAVASLARHPEVFRAAVGMSGTYDLTPWMNGGWSDDLYYSSPLHYLPGLGEGEQLSRLRTRFAILATGTGAHEAPGESWWLADVLGAKGVPNRVDQWPGWAHDWPTWRAMLPGYLHELTA
jgi:esterase/lipase superfamily enzyme